MHANYTPPTYMLPAAAIFAALKAKGIKFALTSLYRWADECLMVPGGRVDTDRTGAIILFNSKQVYRAIAKLRPCPPKGQVDEWTDGTGVVWLPINDAARWLKKAGRRISARTLTEYVREKGPGCPALGGRVLQSKTGWLRTTKGLIFSRTYVRVDDLQGIIDATKAIPRSGVDLDEREWLTFREAMIVFPQFGRDFLEKWAAEKHPLLGDKTIDTKPEDRVDDLGRVHRGCCCYSRRDLQTLADKLPLGDAAYPRPGGVRITTQEAEHQHGLPREVQNTMVRMGKLAVTYDYRPKRGSGRAGHRRQFLPADIVKAKQLIDAGHFPRRRIKGPHGKFIKPPPLPTPAKEPALPDHHGKLIAEIHAHSKLIPGIDTRTKRIRRDGKATRTAAEKAADGQAGLFDLVTKPVGHGLPAIPKGEDMPIIMHRVIDTPKENRQPHGPYTKKEIKAWLKLKSAYEYRHWAEENRAAVVATSSGQKVKLWLEKLSEHDRGSIEAGIKNRG